MQIYTFQNLSIFRYTSEGFVPLPGAGSSGQANTSDFAAGYWGLFSPGGSGMIKITGPMNFMTYRETKDATDDGVNNGWEPEKGSLLRDDSTFTSSSLDLTYRANGFGDRYLGSLIAVGLRYGGARQDIGIVPDSANAFGDGRLSLSAEYDALGADREVFFAFVPSLRDFWTQLGGVSEAQTY